MKNVIKQTKQPDFSANNRKTGSFLLWKLAIIQRIIKSFASKKLVVPSCFNNHSILHNEDDICFLNCRKSVSDDKACSAFHHIWKGLLYLHFGYCINRGRCFVKYKHRGKGKHQSGNTDKLLLSLGKLFSSFTYLGVIAVFKSFNK